MKKILFIFVMMAMIISIIGCEKETKIEKNIPDDPGCCTCLDCPECDVCCDCANPYLNK